MEKIVLEDRLAVSLEKIEKPYHQSFHTGVFKESYFSRAWHYHPEFELLFISKGSGKRLVGDHAEAFEENDLVLLGGLLPHAWISDPRYFDEDSEDYCESLYVQFRKETFGMYFIDVPELKGLRKTLRLAERGLKVRGNTKQEIIELFKPFASLSPLDQLLKLIKILNLISISDYELLASEQYIQKRLYFKTNRMLKVHEYIMEQFNQEVSIDICSDLANMTKSSFCRFFKNETKSTFSDYVNKIRIDFSKKLLANTNLPVKEIAYQCGFNSVPYFNKRFKKLLGISPFAYRKSAKV